MIDNLILSGVNFTLFVQRVGTGLVPFMKVITQLGTINFYLLVMPILYWSIDASLGIRLGLILMTSAGLNNIIKLALHLPRPFWVSSPVQGYVVEPTFGAPSGHAQNSLSMVGLIAAKIKGPWAWGIAALLTFLVGISRVFLGVHFYFDTILGWILGGLLLFIFLKVEKPVADWLRAQKPWPQFFAILAASLMMVVLGVLATLGTASFQAPTDWEANAVHDVGVGLADVVNLGEVITPMGVLLGFGLGALWLERRGGFRTQGKAGQHVLRFLLGVAGVLLFWRGLDLVFPDGQDLVASAFRYLRYALVGFWVAGLAPFLFVRLGLSEKKA